MTLFSADQISYTTAGYLRLANLASGAANNTVITTQLSTLVATANRNGGSVPLQVSTSNGVGFYTSSPNNRAEISLNSSGDRVSDGNGNEVYARLTESGAAYTLRYFSMVAGVETAYAFTGTTNLDCIFNYVFDWATAPVNAHIAAGTLLVANDPVGGNIRNIIELPTIVSLNTLPALTFTPADPSVVKVVVRGQALYPGGALPDFTVGGTGNKTLTWSAANAGYSIQPGWRVVYEYARFL